MDGTYGTRQDRIQSINFDLFVNGGNKWTFGVGKRLNVDVDDVITTQFHYVINPKWTFQVYERFNLELGLQREQEFTLTRDLHEWKVDFIFNESRGEGTEILMRFTLKAFPEAAFDAGTSFNKRKAASQSTEGLRD